jgi:hypothetical protein
MFFTKEPFIAFITSGTSENRVTPNFFLLQPGVNKKWVSYLYRTATTVYPCYLPILGEFNRSWSYKTYPAQKYNN